MMRTHQPFKRWPTVGTSRSVASYRFQLARMRKGTCLHVPGTQMTPVLNGKGLVLEGLTFKNRGQLGSRYVFTKLYKLWWEAQIIANDHIYLSPTYIHLWKITYRYLRSPAFKKDWPCSNHHFEVSTLIFNSIENNDFWSGEFAPL